MEKVMRDYPEYRYHLLLMALEWDLNLVKNSLARTGHVLWILNDAVRFLQVLFPKACFSDWRSFNAGFSLFNESIY